jgi:1-acyl-sn-glycerol-3-phosphate acyltransferase
VSGPVDPLARGAERAAAERARRRRTGTPLLPQAPMGTTGTPTPRSERHRVVELVAEEAGERLADALAAATPPPPATHAARPSAPHRLAVVPDVPDTPDASPDATSAAPGPDGSGPTPPPVVAAGEADDVLAGPPTDAEGREHLAELLLDAVDFVRRRLEGDYAVDEFGFDPELTERVLLALLRPIYRRWFRVELRGADRIPAERGALLVGNHSGTLAWDALMTQVAVHEATDGRFLRLLGADLVFATPVMGDVARRMGATLAANSDAERLLSSGQLVGVWPEGFKGIGKNYRDRYRLQRFGRGGFVSAAIRTQVPIIPVSIVGAEEIYPMLADVRPLARLTGAPYWPVTPTWPWLGPLGLVPLPSKWLIEFGEPIATDELDPSAAEDPMVVFEITDRVREVIQQTLYALLVQRRSVFLG